MPVMGLFDVFRGRDPSEDWRREPDLRLEFDLSAASLCGIRLGDPADRLSKLGAPDNRHAHRDGFYEYVRDGFSVDAEEGVVTCFALCWNPPDRPRYAEFAGRVLFRGRPADVGPRMSEADFVGLVGEPWWRDEDDDEMLLWHEFPPVEWQAEFSLSGLLRALTVLTPPAMAEEQYRKDYRVTAPWPPGESRKETG